MDLFKRVGAQPTTGGQRVLKADEAARSAMAHLEAGDLRQAESELRRAIGFDSGNVGLRGYLGVVLLQSGRLADANKELQAAIGLAPAQAMLRYIHGQILEALLRQDAAADEYAAASSLDPQNAEYLTALASLELKRNNIPEATELIRVALEIDPDQPQALADFAEILRQRGDLGGAIDALRRSVSIRPDNADDQYRLGTLLEEAGYLDLAITHLRAAHEALFGDVEVVYALSRVLMKSHRVTDAMNVYARVMKQDPDNRSIYEADLARLKTQDLGNIPASTSAQRIELLPTATVGNKTEIAPPAALSSVPLPPQPSAQPVASPSRDVQASPTPASPALRPVAADSPASGQAVIGFNRPLSARKPTPIEQLEDEVAADPNNPRLHQSLSILYLQTGRLVEAKEQARLAEALRTPRPNVRSTRTEPSKGGI